MVAAQFLREGAARPETLVISVPERHYDMLQRSRDVFFPALVLPCMKTGESFDVGGAISGAFLDQYPELQDIYLSWYPDLRPVDVLADRAASSPPAADGVASFFSAGADSFHTLREAVSGHIRGVENLDYLIWVRSTAGRTHRGFGRPLQLGESNDSSAVESEMEEIAKRTGTTLIRVDTNIQALFPDFNWSLYHHGGGLASISLALSRGIGRQLISSGWSYRDLHPWGSHPATDPLWSTDYLSFQHYGNHVSRAEKIVYVVANDQLALDHLRVCNYNSSITNCGACYKCLRTMIPLDMVGKLGQARTFPAQVPEDISMAFMHDDGTLDDEPLYRLARKLGREDYARRIKAIIDKRNRRRAMRQLMESTPMLSPVVEPLRRARRALKR